MDYQKMTIKTLLIIARLLSAIAWSQGNHTSSDRAEVAIRELEKQLGKN